MQYFNDNKTVTNCYIGKPTNGNFITARSGATTITLSGFPAGLTSVTDKDIEAIRQIDNTGHVIKVYNRINNKITVSTNIITVEGASFAATDTLIVYTNIPATAADIDISGSASSGSSGNLIGKSTGNGGDFTVAWASGTTLTLGGYPFGITSFDAIDIEMIRQINTSGVVVATYHRDDTTMSISTNTLTVTGAAFAASDNFIIYTNVPRPTDVEVMGEIMASTSYIGKSAGLNGGDFVVAYTAPTQVTLSSYPGAITAFHDGDIELIRVIEGTGGTTPGKVRAIYHRNDAVMTIAANVLTVSGAAFVSTDSFVIVTNVAKPSSGGAGGAGGGSIVYTNMSGDFVATPTNGAATITITGLPFTLEAKHVAAGSIVKIAATTYVKTTLSPSSISVSGGVITLGGITNFATGDELAVTLIGPDKAYDTALDNQLVNIQNPNYAHTTSVETLIDQDNLGTRAQHDAAGASTTIFHKDAQSYSNANVAIGYSIYHTTTAIQSAIVSAASAHEVTSAALSGGATWDVNDYGNLPGVGRYEISADTYNFLSLHYKITAAASNTCYMKIYGTNNPAATVDDDTSWVNMSLELLGADAGVSVTNATIEDIVIIDTPQTLLKYMVKIVSENAADAAFSNSFDVFIKKSS